MMDESLSAIWTEDELPDQNKAQLDFPLPRLSNGWEETPKFMKRLEAHEEFEFTMSHNMVAMKADLYEPAMEVQSPADELFFRGQLLPLQHDPRLHLVHTLSCIKGEGIHQVEESLANISSENVVGFARGELMDLHSSPNGEGFPMHLGNKGRFHGKYGNEEGSDHFVGEGVDNIRSVRSDHGASAADACKNDSRSSSFRSQHSSYWGSGEKDSRDSSGSSRCSNGSSQDACYYNGTRASSHHNRHAMPNVTAIRSVVNVSAKANHHSSSCTLPQYGKPPLPASNARVKKWSWKSLLNGLKKASKMWADDRSEEQDMHDTGTKQNRTLFGLATSSSRLSLGMESDAEYRNVGGHGGEMKKLGARHGSSTSISERNKGMANVDSSRSYYTQGSGGGAPPARPWRAVNYYEGSSINGGRAGSKQLEKPRMGIIAWNARESWQRWVKKPLLHRKVSSTTQPRRVAMSMMHEDELEEEEDAMANYISKSLSSTPLIKSPVRKTVNMNGAISSAQCTEAGSLIKYGGLGFAASCPASMRSSPHNSGVLAVVSKSPAACSSLHDLHTAIQGAIAHCKQSHTS